MVANGSRIAVIGGANTDIVGRSAEALVARDSNPGAISVSSGGVGRNIAENLARLGCDTALVTAFGGDHNARELRRHCEEVGIGVEASIVCEDLPGSAYVAILADDGDMALALSDMRALDRLTPTVLERALAEIGDVGLFVCDANLSPDALEWLAATVSVPVVFDPASAVKARRARGILGRLAAVKCNVAEAAVLLGDEGGGDGGAEPCGDPATLASGLVEAGAGIALVTAGAADGAVAWPNGSRCVPAPAVEVVNATGAGDALTAGMAAMLLEGADPVSAARFGTAMAALTLGSSETVSSLIGRAAVHAMMEEDAWGA